MDQSKEGLIEGGPTGPLRTYVQGAVNFEVGSGRLAHIYVPQTPDKTGKVGDRGSTGEEGEIGQRPIRPGNAPGTGRNPRTAGV